MSGSARGYSVRLSGTEMADPVRPQGKADSRDTMPETCGVVGLAGPASKAKMPVAVLSFRETALLSILTRRAS